MGRPKGFEARRRAAKRRKLDAAELKNMQKARVRDAHCRFPLCPCHEMIPLPHRTLIELTGEISHAEHRGSGGNPKGDRTVPEKLLLLCNWRHKLAKFSVDRKTIRWEPLTAAGANGPIRWLIDLMAFNNYQLRHGGRCWLLPFLDGEVIGWTELARETELHSLEPLTDAQAAILSLLAGMEC